MKTTRTKQESRERIRKSGTAGVITQKAMTFRVDQEVLEWLSQQRNKGRYINNLIYQDMTRQRRKEGSQ